MKKSALAGLALMAGVACSSMDARPAADPREAEAAVRAYLDHVHAFEYEAMRDAASADFEILIAGRRMDLDAFIAYIQELEASRGGRPLTTHEVRDFNTRIAGDVAYTSWVAGPWLESVILVRAGDRWRVERGFSMLAEPRQP